MILALAWSRVTYAGSSRGTNWVFRLMGPGVGRGVGTTGTFISGSLVTITSGTGVVVGSPVTFNVTVGSLVAIVAARAVGVGATGTLS